MLCKLLSPFIYILFVTFVSCQQYISISVPSSVKYKVDKLKFICSALNVPSEATVTSITLSKNSSSGYQDVVRVFLDLSNNQIKSKTKWFQNGMQSRATEVSMNIRPPSSARLEFNVNATRVICSDAGTYQCSIKGTTISGELFEGGANAIIAMTVEATSINQIQALPQQPEGIYNPYTEVRLTCTGTVGNPPQNLRWCYRRSGIDLNFIGYPNTADIDQGTAFPQDCQFSRTSTLVYNVTTEYENVAFRCETGGTSTLCGHASAFASNYTIYRYTVPGPSSGQGGEDTASGGVIAGAVIGSFVGIVLIIVIVYFVAFRKKNEGETYKTKEENGTSAGPIDNTVYSVPHKDHNGRDRNSPRDKHRHYENKGLDEPHTRGYRPNMDPRGRSNPAMERSFDDDRDNNIMSSRGPMMGSNASFGSAV